MSGGARRPRYRQAKQQSVKNGKWGKAGIMSCQFRSKRGLCNSIRSRAGQKKETTSLFDPIPNVNYPVWTQFYDGTLNPVLDRTSGIRQIIDKWLNPTTRPDIEAKYGKIEDWDTSNVTNMSWLFYNKSVFNDDISKWKTSNVTTMEGMFGYASSFNKDLDGWNVKKVTSLKMMFYSAAAFDQNLSSWEPNVCKDFDFMFTNAFATSQINGIWTSITTFTDTLNSRLVAAATSVGFFSTNSNYFFHSSTAKGSTGQYPKLNN